jgi:hypothetical protein
VEEIVGMGHRQAVAIGAGVAPVTNLTTGAAIGEPLRVRLTEVSGVGWRALGVALTATLFAPIVTALAKRQIAAGFLNVGSHKALRVGHRHPVTVSTELLLVASGATLNALSQRFQSVTAFPSSRAPYPLRHKVRLLVGFRFRSHVAVGAKGLSVASGASLGVCLTVRCRHRLVA